MILRVAGVELEAIGEDHAQSDAHLASWWQPWHDDARDDEERERRVRVTTMADGAMTDVLATIDARDYLLAGDVDEQEIDRLVARLRGET